MLFDVLIVKLRHPRGVDFPNIHKKLIDLLGRGGILAAFQYFDEVFFSGGIRTLRSKSEPMSAGFKVERTVEEILCKAERGLAISMLSLAPE
jgi:hypothetical protein